MPCSLDFLSVRTVDTGSGPCYNEPMSNDIIFHESYGEVSKAQLAAYRKYNVSPSDHDDLAYRFGEDAHAAITAAVKQFSPNGMFSSFAMFEAERDREFGVFTF